MNIWIWLQGPPPLPHKPPPQDLQDLSSPEDDSPHSAPVEVFDLPESSSEGGVTPDMAITPDMDPQVLFIKLKEAQYRNAVSEAELAKVKARVSLSNIIFNFNLLNIMHYTKYIVYVSEAELAKVKARVS